MKNKKLFPFLAVLIFALINFSNLYAQNQTDLSFISPRTKPKIKQHLKALETKDKLAFTKSISPLFAHSKTISKHYSSSLALYSQYQGSVLIQLAKQIRLKKIKNLSFDGKGNDVITEEGFLVLIPLKEKLSLSQRLPFDAMRLPIIRQSTAGYGFPPSFSMAFIVDANGFIWGGDGP